MKFTISVELTHTDGPKRWPVDEIRQALEEQIDGVEIWAQDPDRDDESGYSVNVTSVTADPT